ncbi:MAG: hypothetical protein ACRCSO_12080, partial [Sphingomonas sp.]
MRTPLIFAIAAIGLSTSAMAQSDTGSHHKRHKGSDTSSSSTTDPMSTGSTSSTGNDSMSPSSSSPSTS